MKARSNAMRIGNATELAAEKRRPTRRWRRKTTVFAGAKAGFCPTAEQPVNCPGFMSGIANTMPKSQKNTTFFCSKMNLLENDRFSATLYVAA
jgi:hypothetical protein